MRHKYAQMISYFGLALSVFLDAPYFQNMKADCNVIFIDTCLVSAQQKGFMLTGLFIT